MTGVDTNVLIRYLVQDDPQQSAAARRFIEEELSPENKGLVSSIVFCEVIWVLSRAYKQPKEKLLEVIHGILETDVFEVERRECAWRAFYDFEEGKADFSDYYIGEINRVLGADSTVTFDGNAAKSRLFKALGDSLG